MMMRVCSRVIMCRIAMDMSRIGVVIGHMRHGHLHVISQARRRVPRRQCGSRRQDAKQIGGCNQPPHPNPHRSRYQ
jgi:hypothetical protein